MVSVLEGGREGADGAGAAGQSRSLLGSGVTKMQTEGMQQLKAARAFGR